MAQKYANYEIGIETNKEAKYSFLGHFLDSVATRCLIQCVVLLLNP